MQIVSYSHNLVSGFCPCYPKKRKDSIFFMPSFLLIIYCNSVFNLPENPKISPVDSRMLHLGSIRFLRFFL